MHNQTLSWIHQGFVYSNGFCSDHWSWNFVETGQHMFPGVSFWADRTSTMENLPNVSINADYAMPSMSEKISWEEARVARIQDIISLLDSDDDLCLDVAWSGGIDSTFVVCALLDGLPKNYKSRLRVGVSAASIGENPYFFRDILVPNFKLFDIQHTMPEKNHLVITGGQGDKIMENEMMLRWACGHQSKDQSLYRNIDGIINLLTEHLGSQERSKKVLEAVLGTAYGRKIKLETVSDALWWLGFNFGWVGMMFYRWGRSVEHTLHPSEQNKMIFSWFASVPYQHWSMWQSARFADAGDFMMVYKKPAKDFIHSVYPNKYYQIFKQKISSSTLIQNEYKKSLDQIVLAITDSGETIRTTPKSLQDDLEKLGMGIKPISL